MISEKVKVAKGERRARKEADRVKRLMEQYLRNGLLSKEKYNQYLSMIEEQEDVCDKAKQKDGDVNDKGI